jgi:hypothetical protein
MRIGSPHVSSYKLPAIYPHSTNPLCPICNQPVPLENAKTEEHGLAIHEECYLLKMQLERATS